MKNPFQRFISKLLPGFCAGLVLLVFQGAQAQAPGAARTAPSWLRDGIVYEVFPRAFSKEGNLKGVTSHLDQLKELGVSIIWLMPIHPIGIEQRKGSYGSPYAARDYYAIDPDYGTKDDLKHLVAEAHKRGMKVILDVVLLHTSWDNVLIAAHPDFYKHNAQGKIVSPVPEWDDVAGLNYENPALRQYMITMLKYWLTEAGLDGYRCDTASMLPTSFWEEARAALSKVKPDMMMLAEADKPELLTNAFDIDYAWPMLNTVRSVLEKSAPASDIQRVWENDSKRYPQGALRLSMSDNHDQPRAVSCFGATGALAVSALMFTLNGVPMLYNGMEVGDATESGDPALFEKVPIFWEPKGRPRLRAIYHDLIQLRKQHPAFRSSDVQWIDNSNGNELVTFLRADDKDEFLVVINFSNRPITGRVNLKNANGFQGVKITGTNDTVDATLPVVHLNGFGWHIYQRSANLTASK